MNTTIINIQPQIFLKDPSKSNFFQFQMEIALHQKLITLVWYTHINNQQHFQILQKLFDMETVLRNENDQSPLLSTNTNEVLIEEKKDKIFYYLPCYVRFKVKSVNEFDVEKLSGVISGTLLFGFYFGNLPEHLLQQFTRDGSKAVTLQFARQASIELRQNTEITFKPDRKNKIFDYVIRTDFNCNLEGDVFATPFEVFNLYLSITAQTVVLDPKENNAKNIHIKFNCMNSQKVSIIDSAASLDFGRYALAGYYLDSDVSNSASHRFSHIKVTDPEKKIETKKEKKKGDKNKKEEKQKPKEQFIFKGVQDYESNAKVMITPHETPKAKIEVQGSCQPEKEKKLKNYQYSHFRIPLYKYPVSSILEIFIPLWILAAINLGIYFQDSNVLADKIASIATVTLALVAFIPTINEKIPQTSMVKLIEIIIYLQVLTTFLTLLDSLFVRKEDPGQYQTDTGTNGFFLITLIINVFCIGIVLVLLVLHKCWWEKLYTKEREKKITGKMNKDLWENKECDEDFKYFIENEKIVPVVQQTEQVKVSSSSISH